jgi:plastocyanin
MRASRLSIVLLLGFVVAACSQYSSNGPTSIGSSGGSLSAVSGQGGGSSPLAAVMQFGREDVGSPFPPSATPHDQSAHAEDNVVPRTVVIRQGGTVTFNTVGIHQVAIYADGTTPEDIDTSALGTLPAGCPPLPLIIDGDGLIQRFSNGCGPRTLQWKFNTPGRYLVICAVLPHFNVGMYAWVEVKES